MLAGMARRFLLCSWAALERRRWSTLCWPADNSSFATWPKSCGNAPWMLASWFSHIFCHRSEFAWVAKITKTFDVELHGTVSVCKARACFLQLQPFGGWGLQQRCETAPWPLWKFARLAELDGANAPQLLDDVGGWWDSKFVLEWTQTDKQHVKHWENLSSARWCQVAKYFHLFSSQNNY